MTALENILVGRGRRATPPVSASALFRLPKHRREERQGHERARELLDFMGLTRRADELARNLPYGDQRRLEIARALATDPTLLCLDEPAAGFNPAEKRELMDLIRRIRDQGYTVLLIEHDMRLVMGVTDRIVVLEFGRKIAEGQPRGHPQRPGRHRGLPGSGRGCFLRSRACASTTDASRPSATSRSASPRAASSR